MSTNHTDNLGLSQWLATDEFKREDFNADNAAIDAAVAQLLDSMPKVIVGSYVGTGTYGRTNPNILTFEAQPKLVLIQQKDNTNNYYCCFSLIIWGTPRIPMVTANASQNAYSLYASYEGNTVSWYDGDSGADSSRQLNLSEHTYSYLAIC